MAAGTFSVSHALGIPHEYDPIAGAALVAVVLTVVGIGVHTKLRKIDDHVLPEPKITLVNIAASIANMWRGMLESIIGHGGEKYLAFIASTFCFILLMNLMGLVPGFPHPTGNLSTNAAMAVTVFVVYNALGFKEHGIGYLKQLTGGVSPKGYGILLGALMTAIALLMIGIEIMGHAIRPVSLSLRLWGNMTGDHALVGVFSSIFPIGLPIVFMAMGVFVSVIQALVFTLLSTVYIKLAVSHDH